MLKAAVSLARRPPRFLPSRNTSDQRPLADGWHDDVITTMDAEERALAGRLAAAQHLDEGLGARAQPNGLKARRRPVLGQRLGYSRLLRGLLCRNGGLQRGIL